MPELIKNLFYFAVIAYFVCMRIYQWRQDVQERRERYKLTEHLPLVIDPETKEILLKAIQQQNSDVEKARTVRGTGTYYTGVRTEYDVTWTQTSTFHMARDGDFEFMLFWHGDGTARIELFDGTYYWGADYDSDDPAVPKNVEAQIASNSPQPRIVINGNLNEYYCDLQRFLEPDGTTTHSIQDSFVVLKRVSSDRRSTLTVWLDPNNQFRPIKSFDEENEITLTWGEFFSVAQVVKVENDCWLGHAEFQMDVLKIESAQLNTRIPLGIYSWQSLGISQDEEVEIFGERLNLTPNPDFDVDDLAAIVGP
ncbi:MAG: hypothetical protein KDA66_18615, partial [Planctomycetaceae bacterium]|nr:hypothetical protein [Planctomycetaceae bacterium]